MNNVMHRLKTNIVCFVDVTDTQIYYSQLSIIKQHGLYDLLDFLFIYNNKHIISLGQKDIMLEYSLLHPNIMLYIEEFSKMAKHAKIFYFHTRKFTDNAEDDAKIREYFNYFLIKKHKLCINTQNDYKFVRAMLREPEISNYFWWATSDYINELDNVTMLGNIKNTDSRMFLTLNNAHIGKIYSYEMIREQILKNLQMVYIKKRPIYGCYFIYCKGAYLKIINEQIDLLLTNGLYNVTDILYVFICGATKQCIDKFAELKKVRVICTNENLCEKYAINNYKKYIFDDKYFLYYFHAKGVSRSKGTTEQQEIIDWRNLCNYFTLVKWRLCLELLEYYNCTGVNLTNFPRRHYSGNFWWATSEHLKGLPDVGTKWLAPEMYICQNPETNCISLHQSPTPLGCVIYNKNNYNKKTDQQILYEITSVPIYNIIANVMFDKWYDPQTADDIDKNVYAYYKKLKLPTHVQTTCSKISYSMSQTFLKHIVLNTKKLKGNIL